MSDPFEKAGLPSRAAEAFSIFLLAAALVLAQVLIGGMRLLFSFPAYGLLAVGGVLALFSLRRLKPDPDQLCLWSAVIFFGYILSRALLSPVPYLARADIYSVLAGLLVYFVVSCILVGAKARLLVVVVLLGAAMVHAFIGAIQFRDGNNFMPISFLQRFDYERRASGFYICPNHLAGLLEVVGIFGLSVVCWSRWPAWAKLLVGYATATAYLGLVLTGSRGGCLSALGSLVLFAVLSLAILRRAGTAPFWKIGGAAAVLAAVMSFVVFFSVQKSDFLSSRAQNVLDTENLRIDLWAAAIKQWKLQPLLGTGSGTYLYYGREFRTDRVQADPIYVHNDYLHLLCEYGVAGALTFLVFLGFHFRRGWKSFRQLGPKRVAVSQRLTSNTLALNSAALCAVGAYIIHSVLDFNLHIPANVLLLAFVFGIIANPGIRREGEPTRVRKMILLWRLSLPVLGLIVAVNCARLLPGEYFTERARVALRDFQPSASVSYALRALDYEKQNPYLYDFLGRARTSLGYRIRDPRARESFYRAAVEAFSKAREISPRDKTFAIDLGLAYDVLGYFDQAEWMYYEAIALDPKSVITREYYRAHLELWQSGEVKKRTVKGNP